MEMRKCKTCWQYKEQMQTQQKCKDCYKERKKAKAKQYQQNTANKQKAKKKKTQTKSQLIRKADKLFSEYIRRKYADQDGYITCISCWKKLHWKESQCCHRIKRSTYKYRRDEDNCRPWCVNCNYFNKEFHQQIFTLEQEKRLWRKKVLEMIEESKKVFNLRISFVREVIEDITEKLKHLAN